MPPKKQKKTMGPWMPLTWRASLGPEGEFREYYLPLSKEEIDADMEHLGSLLQQQVAGGKRRGGAAGGRLVAAQPGGSSSEELSPSSAQADEHENESSNPAEQQWASKAPTAAVQLQVPMTVA